MRDEAVAGTVLGFPPETTLQMPLSRNICVCSQIRNNMLRGDKYKFPRTDVVAISSPHAKNAGYLAMSGIACTSCFDNLPWYILQTVTNVSFQRQ